MLEIPHDSKLVFDPYKYYPDASLADIPSDAPAEYRKQISTLLKEPPADSVVTNLVNSYRDSAGSTIFDQPVINQPWEWIENLGEPSSDPTGEQREREERIRDRVSHLAKNTSSISLERFGARHTGDTVKVDMTSGNYAEMESYTRGFEDGLSESVFMRDWRETRLEWEEELSPDMLARVKSEMNTDVLAAEGVDKALRGDSPASSVVSRLSTSNQKPHQSPAQIRQSDVTGLRVIDVDNEEGITFKSGPSGKRKAAAAMSDEEIELIEGPVQVVPGATSSTLKKQKANKAAATRAKK